MLNSANKLNVAIKYGFALVIALLGFFQYRSVVKAKEQLPFRTTSGECLELNQESHNQNQPLSHVCKP